MSTSSISRYSVTHSTQRRPSFILSEESGQRHVCRKHVLAPFPPVQIGNESRCGGCDLFLIVCAAVFNRQRILDSLHLKSTATATKHNDENKRLSSTAQHSSTSPVFNYVKSLLSQPAGGFLVIRICSLDHHNTRIHLVAPIYILQAVLQYPYNIYKCSYHI